MSLHSFWRAAACWLGVSVLAAGGPLVRPASAQTPFEFIAATFNPYVFDENAGASASAGSITRYTDDLSQALTIQIKADAAGSPTLILPRSVTIPSGQKTVGFAVGVRDDALLNGTRTFLLTFSGGDFFDAYAAVSVVDDEAAFTLEVTPSQIKENAGATVVTGKIKRSQSAAALAADIKLSANAALLKVPASVSLAVGQSEATFPIQVVDNDTFDGTRIATVLAQRDGNIGNSVSAELTLLDDEADLTLTTSQSTLSEGGGERAASLTVGRSRAAAEAGAVTIALDSSDGSEALPPGGVILNRGQREITLPLSAIDDGVVDGPQPVRLRASATNYVDGVADISVSDNDVPALNLSLNTTLISESNGSEAAVGTLSRNTLLDKALTIALRSSDARQISVPARVTIPVGAVSTTFAIEAVDDFVLDGRRSATISASAVGFATRSATLSVLDNEGPSLEISFNRNQVSEGVTGLNIAATGTLRRLNAPLNAPLTVLLSSTDPNVALLQALPTKGGDGTATLSLSIPAGRDSITFALKTPDNIVPEDVRAAIVTATALGFNDGATTLRVTDNRPEDQDDPARLTLSARSALRASAPDPSPRFLFVIESDGPLAMRATVSRNTAATSDVIVFLRPSGQILAPKSVVIPRGAASTTFFVGAIDDDLRCIEDRNGTAGLTASVAGFSDDTQPIFLTDDDPTDGCIVRRRVKVTIKPRVVRDPEAIAENDGPNAATIEVKRADDVRNLTLVVDLILSDPERGQLKLGRVRLAGKECTTIDVNCQRDADDEFFYTFPFNTDILNMKDNKRSDDCIPNLSVTPKVIGFEDPARPGVLIPVSQVGAGNAYEIVSDDVKVLDSDPQILLPNSSPTVISEGGAAGVATGLVTRRNSSSAPLLVRVRTSNAGKVAVSPSNRRDPQATLEVSIPAGQNAASFDIIAIDNNVADGDQFVDLELSTDCSSFVQKLRLKVRDNEVPQTVTPRVSLRLPAAVVENAAPIIGTVSRNTSTNLALEVVMVSSDTSELLAPRRVTIPAGAASTTFTLTPRDDSLKDGFQRVFITATPVVRSIAPARAQIVVTDNE